MVSALIKLLMMEVMPQSF